MGGLLAIALQNATPVLFAMLGETVSERAGVINLGLEGQMLVGAATGFAVTYWTGSPALGLLAGAGAGALLSLVHVLLSQGFGANQIASGLAVLFLGSGLSAYYGTSLVDKQISGFSQGFQHWLGHVPVLGDLLGSLTPTVYLALVLTPVVGVWMYRTRSGLKWRAVGESAEAARMMGVNPLLVRVQAIIVGGLFSGLGGAALAVDYTQTWIENMTAGRGLLAVGLVIVARWNPFWALPAALLYGGSEALALNLQSQGVQISPYLLSLLPYVIPMLVLAGSYRAARQGRGMPRELSAVFKGME
ncbi:MAG: ABC transporter permease [Gammaproteobacteria bacterium]